MTYKGFDYVWNHDRNDGMGGWDIFEHTDEAREHTDFLTGLHAKDKGNDR